MGTKKKTILPNYLKKKLTGTTISGGASIGDDKWTTTPGGSLTIGKNKKSANISISKPFSKFDKENINSTIGIGFTKEGNNSSFTVQGSKTGKKKYVEAVFKKTFNHGGEARVPGSGAAIRGTSFKGIF